MQEKKSLTPNSDSINICNSMSWERTGCRLMRSKNRRIDWTSDALTRDRSGGRTGTKVSGCSATRCSRNLTNSK
jgi:hypothetical protein